MRKVINLEEFMKLSPEERKADALRSMWGSVEVAVTEIARARRTAELTYNIETAEFDARLNELCAIANERFCNMTEAQIAGDMLKEIAKRLDPEDLSEFFMGM